MSWPWFLVGFVVMAFALAVWNGWKALVELFGKIGR